MSPRRTEREPWWTVPRPVPRTPFERSARFWLNAYPRRWRELHGEELLAVLEDVARRDDGSLPERLPRAEVTGLLRAGWGLRWREHPPFWRWLGYRAFGRRLPEQYWWWVADDIRSPLFPLLTVLGSWTTPWTVFMAVNAVRESDRSGLFGNPLFWVTLAGVAIVIGYLMRNSQRRQAWLKHIVGHVPESVRTAAPPPGTMTGTGIDPAITGEPPEEPSDPRS